MAMAGNRFRSLLSPGAPIWALNPGGASLDVADAMARAGARCLFIDCERTAVHIESVTALVRCAHSHGMAAILRSESMAPETLVRYLDRGIDGIVVPHTETLAQLQSIGEVVRYITRGDAARVFAIAQIESAAAVDNAEALAACREVDGFLIGPNDLAHSLGHAGDTRRPEVQSAVDRAIAALQRHGRPWGLPATAGTAGGWGQRGAQFLYGTLEQILQEGFGPMAAAVSPPPRSTA